MYTDNALWHEQRHHQPPTWLQSQTHQIIALPDTSTYLKLSDTIYIVHIQAVHLDTNFEYTMHSNCLKLAVQKAFATLVAPNHRLHEHTPCKLHACAELLASTYEQELHTIYNPQAPTAAPNTGL
jgi:hypothetical protein